MILDEGSLAETLWNLEESRWTGTPADDPEANAALDWILDRPGGYAPELFAPTPADIVRRRAAPTDDQTEPGDLSRWFAGHGARTGPLAPARLDTKHILGEEAVRTLFLWGRAPDWDSAASAGWILSAGGKRPGAFCCAHCSVARWRALAAARPPGWEDPVRDGLAMLQESVVAGRGWAGFPLFYTLLALADIPMPEARLEATRAGVQPDRFLARLVGEGRRARFRRRALEWVMG